MKAQLSHMDNNGTMKMVDISKKQDTVRIASAIAEIEMSGELVSLIKQGKCPKGDVFAVAKCAGIMSAKNTSNLIPLCHQINLSSVDIEFRFESTKLIIKSTIKTTGKTGVEMEAMTAVSVTALTIYDMCKAVDKELVINNTKLLSKTGGKSGVYKIDKVN